MVYLKSWQEFHDQSLDLFRRSPRRTRHSIKVRSSRGSLILKVTDDKTCLKYKTHSAIILNRFEALERAMAETMTNRRPTPPPPVAQVGPVQSPETSSAQKGDAMEGVEAAAAAAAAAAGGGGGGGGAKKKKKKGKKK